MSVMEIVSETRREAPTAVAMTDIVKAFPGVRALNNVSFDCRAGEVHALVGENGAGKSTLIKILGGAIAPDSGRIEISGKPVSFSHPIEAQKAGISIVHQEFNLLPQRTVAQNIWLGREPTRHGVVDNGEMTRATAALFREIGIDRWVTPGAMVVDLAVAQQQLVEIAKALSFKPKALVMDEPTAALNDPEVVVLFSIVRRLRERGLAIVYISHRLSEVFQLASRITVLMDGRVVGTVEAAGTTPATLVKMMVGRELSDLFPPRAAAGSVGPALLTLEDGDTGVIHGVDLTLRAGEITGLAGLQGAGRTEVAAALFGRTPLIEGRLTVKGNAVRLRSPRDAIRAGIGYLTANRKEEALVLQQSVRDNILLGLRAMRPLLSGRYFEGASGKAPVAALEKLVDLRAPSLETKIIQLSGGNKQKAVIARWYALWPDILIFAEPTRGIDVGAKAAIHRLMREIADSGRAILLISSELPELLGISDRILVLRNGRVAGALPGGAAESEVMALAAQPVEADGRGGASETVSGAGSTRSNSWRALTKLPFAYALLLTTFLASWLLVLAFGHGTFVNVPNLENIVTRSVALGITAVGQTFAILVGSVDLSVANLISATSVLASFIMQGSVARIPAAIGAVVLLGVAIGILNGLVITRLKVNPLIATLGVGLLLQGFLSASFNNFSGEVAPSFQSLAYGSIGVVPISPLLLAATALLGAFTLRYTRFGAHVFAVGGDKESARLSGIRSDRVVMFTHVIASLCAVLTGLYLASRLRAGAPWIGRAGVYDMESIAVTVIGGTSFSGGRGSIGGTIAGVLVFGILDSLFNQLGINAYLKQVLRGFIIVGAISSYTWRSREEPA